MVKLDKGISTANFIESAEGPFFITTDNPGIAIELANNKKHGIKLDGGFVLFFPLSYRLALVFTDQEKRWRVYG